MKNNSKQLDNFINTATLLVKDIEVTQHEFDKFYKDTTAHINKLMKTLKSKNDNEKSEILKYLNKVNDELSIYDQKAVNFDCILNDAYASAEKQINKKYGTLFMPVGMFVFKATTGEENDLAMFNHENGDNKFYDVCMGLLNYWSGIWTLHFTIHENIAKIK